MLEQNGGLTIRQIDYAAERMLSSAKEGIDYVAREQGGIHKVEGNLLETLRSQVRITTLFGISELTREIRQIIFERASESGLVDSSLHDPTPQIIENQQSFVRALLGSNPRVIEQLAEIEAKIGIFEDVRHDVQDPNRRDRLNGFSQRVAIWKGVIGFVSRNLCGDDETRHLYQELVSRNQAQLSQPVERRGESADGTKTYKKSYRDRLQSVLENSRTDKFIDSATSAQQGKKLAGDLVDEYLNTAFTLNAVRALDRIQKPLTVRAMHRKLVACLDGRERDSNYEELIRKTDISNRYNEYEAEIRRIKNSGLPSDEEKQKLKQADETFRQSCAAHLESLRDINEESGESIDLITARQQLDELRVRTLEISASDMDATEKSRKLKELDDRFQDVLTPIANKVDRLFPHERSTDLTDVLENEDAVCTGKVAVLLAVSKYLGVNARANGVLEIMDNGTAGHVCFECDLPSGELLVIDSNFSNKAGLENKTDAELIEVIKRRNHGISDEDVTATLKFYKRAIANAEYIPEESRVLTYRLQRTDQIVESQSEVDSVRGTDYHSMRLDPYTGEKRVWVANVPFPHQITSPDKDGYLYMNSSFCNNTARHIAFKYPDIARYLFERQIEMSPYETKAHIGLAKLLDTQESIAYLARLKTENPTVYYDGVDCELADYYVRSGDIGAAIAVYEKIKVQNAARYFREIHRLSRSIVNSTNPNSPDYPERIEQAKQILESIREETPEEFFKHKDNIDVLHTLYTGNEEARIALLEKFEQVAPDEFWTSIDVNRSSSPTRRLIDSYEKLARINASYNTCLASFYQRVKNNIPDYYVANAYKVAKISEPGSEIGLLEEAKQLNLSAFHAIVFNTVTLAQQLKKSGKIDEAIKLFKEAKEVNPDLFWNGKLDSTYEELVKLYESSGNIEEAISVCEEAKQKSRAFWKQSYLGGYHKLSSLLEKTGRTDEAITLVQEAREHDIRFFNPLVNNSGYIQLGLLFAKTGQLDQAIDVFRLGVNQDEEYWVNRSGQPTCMHLVDVYESHGQFQLAIDILTKLRNEDVEGWWKTGYYRITGFLDSVGVNDQASSIRTELIALYEEFKQSNPLYYRLIGYRALAKLYSEERRNS